MAKEAVVQKQEPESFNGTSITDEQIAVLAYSLWQGRGCPDGNPEEDWFNAERALRANTEA